MCLEIPFDGFEFVIFFFKSPEIHHSKRIGSRKWHEFYRTNWKLNCRSQSNNLFINVTFIWFLVFDSTQNNNSLAIVHKQQCVALIKLYFYDKLSSTPFIAQFIHSKYLFERQIKQEKIPLFSQYNGELERPSKY